MNILLHEERVHYNKVIFETEIYHSVSVVIFVVFSV